MIEKLYKLKTVSISQNRHDLSILLLEDRTSAHLIIEWG